MDGDFCHKVREALGGSGRWAWSAAWARSGCAASPGGRARSRSPRSSTATTSTAAATCPPSRGPGPRRRPTRGSARWTRSTASCSSLSPWAVRNLRFDESLGQLHGYDLDFCLQVREAGRKVMTADFRAIHHHSLELVSDPEGWIEAHIKVADKWEGRMRRHRLGGGHLEAARPAGRGRGATPPGSPTTARCSSPMRGYEHLERALGSATDSISWRITAPLRRVNRLRRRAVPGCGSAISSRATSRSDRLRGISGGGESLPPLLRAGHRARRRSPTRRSTSSPRSGRSRGPTTCCSRPRGDTMTSRRSCWCTRTPRSPTPTSARRSAGAE